MPLAQEPLVPEKARIAVIVILSIFGMALVANVVVFGYENRTARLVVTTPTVAEVRPAVEGGQGSGP
jgi:hypothetical protein